MIDRYEGEALCATAGCHRHTRRVMPILRLCEVSLSASTFRATLQSATATGNGVSEGADVETEAANSQSHSNTPVGAMPSLPSRFVLRRVIDGLCLSIALPQLWRKANVLASRRIPFPEIRIKKCELITKLRIILPAAAMRVYEIRVRIIRTRC